MRVLRFAWCEDSGHVVNRPLKGEFVSVCCPFDDEYHANNLMSCGNVQQHGFASVRRGQDWVCCQDGLYFLESGRGSVRPLEVFGAPKEAVKGQCLFSQAGDKAA